MKVLNVSCPNCNCEFNYYTSISRPFCSQRCRDIDLGHWLTESYKVPSQQPLSETDIEVIIRTQDENNNE